LRITKSGATQYFPGAPQNIGVLLGPASGGLTDVDLDCPEAMAAAPFFLTTTQCFSRPSKRCSHWPYITNLAETDDRATLKFTDVQKPERVLLEIRTGGGGHAAQTVFPGSVHPSGETIAWEGKSPSSNTSIPKVDGADLKQRAAKIAACALLAQNYPKAGGRHEGAIVVTGFLCRCGFSVPVIKTFIEALAVATCQPLDKRKDMIKTASDMAAGSAAGNHTYGFKKLEETFSKPVAQKCAEWLGYKAEFRPGVGAVGDDCAKDFVRGEGGRIIKTSPENSRLAIKRLGVSLHLNEFSGQTEITGLPSFDAGELTDAMAIRLRFLINEQFSFLPSNDLLTQILTDIASQNRYHPVRDYLNGLVWDGVPRIGNWLIRYAGAEDTDFNKAAGRIFLLAGVRRVRLPGVKFDTVLVFESVVQGQNKSTALRILAVKDEWFSDNLQLGASAKESIEGTQGIWIVEFGELSGTQRRDRDQILTFLSRQDDRARVAYGRRSERFPRQFIGAATTNKTEYLAQEERRILPVAIKKFDLGALRRDRDQLWAEAAHYEAQGETISLPERLWKDAAEVRKNRRQENPFIAVLAEYLEKLGHPDTVAPAQIWEALGETSKRLDGTTELRPIPVERRARHCTAMGEAMAELGYAKRRDKSRGANRDKIYYEKEPGLGLGG
jgi:hypothetical protein